jgi:hypothetical protein
LSNHQRNGSSVLFVALAAFLATEAAFATVKCNPVIAFTDVEVVHGEQSTHNIQTSLPIFL